MGERMKGRKRRSLAAGKTPRPCRRVPRSSRKSTVSALLRACQRVLSARSRVVQIVPGDQTRQMREAASVEPSLVEIAAAHGSVERCSGHGCIVRLASIDCDGAGTNPQARRSGGRNPVVASAETGAEPNPVWPICAFRPTFRVAPSTTREGSRMADTVGMGVPGVHLRSRRPRLRALFRHRGEDKVLILQAGLHAGEEVHCCLRSSRAGGDGGAGWVTMRSPMSPS